MTALILIISSLIIIPISIVIGVVWVIVNMLNISKAAKIIITITVSMVIINSCGLYNHHNEKASIQEDVPDMKETNEINDKYHLALQAKNQKDWNKVIAVLNAIDMNVVRKNTEAFKAKYKINSDKDLKTAITEERRNESLLLSKEERESRYNELIKIKPITVSQINILKQFAEGMIEIEAGNYKKADDIFSRTHDAFESDIADEYTKISNETRKKLTVEVPVKVINATCIMKYDNTFRTEIPYFTITIENPLDEPIHVSNLVERAIHKNGESAHYSYPFEYECTKSINLDIPAKSKAVYKWHSSVFLDDIKYYLLKIDDFYMKNSQKLFTESTKYTEAKIFKVEAKY